MAKKILELEDDYCGIMSVLGAEITTSSAPAAVRKQYLLLSRIIHPDKLPGFGQATKAFQLLVSALDGLTRPDMRDADTAKPRTKTISRSNEGCHRTQVLCPRCHAPWGEAADGHEAAAYSHLMTGIKTYCCSTCLLEFGCMSAEHKCPFCRKLFDYSPEDFHNKIKCGNKGCSREFGFMLYNVSETRLKQLKEELKATQEKRLKRQEALDSRNARARAKKASAGGEAGPGADAAQDSALKEEVAAFRAGLLDACPQCGCQMGKRDGAEEAEEHLGGCKDAKKIAAHQRRKAVEAAKQSAKANRHHKQDQLTNLKTWEFLGGANESLWMLSVEQLRQQCAQYKLEEDGDKEALIARLVRHRNSLDASRLLTDANSHAPAKHKPALPTSQSLPSNLESMSLSQLKAVAAAHGIEVGAGASAAGALAAIEAQRFRHQPQMRLTMTAEHEEEGPPIKRAPNRKPAPKKGRGKALEESDEEEEEEEEAAAAAPPKKRARKSTKQEEESGDDDDDDEFVPDA